MHQRVAVVFVVTAATKSSETLQKFLEQSSQEINSLNKSLSYSSRFYANWTEYECKFGHHIENA